MRKIINSTYITLDGVVDEPHLWPSPDRPSDLRATSIQTDLVLSCDALLMGRRTYDVFASAWPTRSGDPLSDQMNAMPKHVVSSTLRDPAWTNTTVIAGDVLGQLRALKEADGKDIVQFGFGPVSRLLLDHGMLDELRLWVYPLLLGSGDTDQLLFGRTQATSFHLADTTALSDGKVILTYRTDRALTTS